MSYPSLITDIHIELTDKCQAACPMCARNHFGGADREFIQNIEITLKNIKQWLPREFLINLKNFYACGTLGDPIIAKDCLEIFKYIRNNTNNCRLAIHTNGSMRTPEWWKKLATVMGSHGEVIFAIDGFKGEHELYRRGTNWDKIIENAKAFISMGGLAKADCLIFKHNEDRIEELKEYLLSIGFKEVNLKTTDRFYGDNTFPVLDRRGNEEYKLLAPVNSKWTNKMTIPKIEELAKEVKFNKMMQDSIISPKCAVKKEIFIDARGQVFPCCWTGTVYLPVVDSQNSELSILRDKLKWATQYLMDDVGVLNLHGCTDIIDLLSNSQWRERFPKHWTIEKNFVCVKQCATNWKSLVE